MLQPEALLHDLDQDQVQEGDMGSGHEEVWSSDLKQNIDFTFLHWSLSHHYNYEMNDNNIADQLQLVYPVMRF